jgi:hypothetical protein
MQELYIYLCLFMHVKMATQLYNNITDPIIIMDNLLFHNIPTVDRVGICYTVGSNLVRQRLTNQALSTSSPYQSGTHD